MKGSEWSGGVDRLLICRVHNSIVKYSMYLLDIPGMASATYKC